jgi:hypothetical protein
MASSAPPSRTSRAARSRTTLAAPGENDLTVQVDFGALARAAGTLGAAAHGPAGVDQALGARPHRRGPVGGGPGGQPLDPLGKAQGFKVLGLAGPGQPLLPGLPPAALPVPSV